LSGSDVTVGQFQKQSPAEQAVQILTKGKPELADGVHILSDPATVLAFKTHIQKIVTSGCAANGCHGGTNAKGGAFYQFTTGDPTRVTYTDFLILQTFRQNVDKVQQPLVNREFPEKSLLLQYMMPRNVAETPHPDAQNFKALVKAKNDVRF